MKQLIWHNLSVEKILGVLETKKDGLTDEEVVRRLKKFGPNKLPEERRLPALTIFLNQFKSPLVFILIIAAAVAFTLREFIDCSIVLAAVLINAVIGFVQENKSERTLYSLKKMVKREARVIRRGVEHVIDTEDLVPGDVILLEGGDIIPADARLIEAYNLQVVEAVLTGESIPSSKHPEVLEKGVPLADRENMVYSATVCSRGKGKAVVVATGLGTEIGRIARLIIGVKEEATPLQQKIAELARILGSVIAGLCVLIFLVGLLTGRGFIEILLTSVAVAVAAIPEGLIIAVTLCLTVGMGFILKRKALVRRLIATETLGSVTAICSDKTGTLTEGKMAVAHVLPGLVPEKGDPREVLKIGLLCNNAIIENPKEELEKWIIHGDTTEIALLRGGVEAGLEREPLLKEYPRIAEIPFEAERMYMATLHKIQNPKSKIQNVIYVKGAPEKLLALSTHIRDGKERVMISAGILEKLKKECDGLTAKGLRVLGFASRDIKKEAKGLTEEDIRELTFEGLVALKDPLRPEAKPTIASCKEARIRPIIVTGDHRLTAQAIAEEIGLYKKGDEILDGPTLDKLSDESLGQKVAYVNIFARVEPKHKIRIVNALKKRGEVVAMTGDGVNDAPALKAADIGIALGSGTEVAKEVSDVVLLDDNFKTIVDAVSTGRTIFDNIKKVVLFLLSDTFTEVILIVGSLILGWPLALLPAQILWVNIIEDTLPAMALSYEKAKRDPLKEKPRARQVPVMDKEIKFLVFVIGFFTDLILLGLFWYLLRYSHYDIAHIRSMVFVGLGIGTLFYVFACKSLEKTVWHYNPLDNPFLNFSVLFGWAMFFIALYIPFFQRILRVVPLNWFDWSILVGFGLLNLILIEITKLYFIRKKTY